MRNDCEVAMLCQIYREMDTEGKEKMVAAATQLYNVQRILENQQVSEYLSCSNTKIDPKPQTFRFNGTGYIITGVLLLFSAVLFWITLINPALLMLGDTPLIMLRIIITALLGMFIIGTGFLRFLLGKFTILWMLLAIGAGILCVDPAVLTDLIGLAIIALIVAVQVIQGKREKAVTAI